MRIFEPKNAKEITDLLTYLNFCHDGSMRRICFLKKRDVDKKDGSIIYPFKDIKDLINCDVEIELILNSYPNAKKNQIILFEYKGIKSFTFMQNEDFDYSDVVDLEFKMDANLDLNFIFYSTEKKIKFLSIACKKFICKEV